MPPALAGIGVLVTRPAHQAGPLTTLIEAAGGRVVVFPTLAIAPPADPVALGAVIENLATYDIAVFVSPNAVTHALAAIERVRGAGVPRRLRVAAVGEATAQRLQRSHIDVHISPVGRYDSEALLALASMRDVRGKRIVIFRGDEGRPLLGDTLTSRGAHVDYALCYRRVAPRRDPAPVIDAFAQGLIDVVTVTSVVIVRNLFTMLAEAGREYLVATPFVAISDRVALACEELGCRHRPRVARAATDAGMLEALIAWRGESAV